MIKHSSHTRIEKIHRMHVSFLGIQKIPTVIFVLTLKNKEFIYQYYFLFNKSLDTDEQKSRSTQHFTQTQEVVIVPVKAINDTKGYT